MSKNIYNVAMNENDTSLNNGMPPVKPPVAPPEQQTAPKSPTPSLKNIRTYESDVADLLAKRNTSAVTIALAESRRKQGKESLATVSDNGPSRTGIKILIVVLILLFLGGGIFGAFYLYSKSPLAPQPSTYNPPQSFNTLIPVDSQTVIEINAIGLKNIKEKVLGEMSKSQTPNTIRELALVTAGPATNNGSANPKTMVRIPASTMVSGLGISMPDILSRSLTPNWMMGVYSNGSGQESLFVIVTNNFFQNAFAGMLQWESIMADDIKNYIIPTGVNGVANALSVPNGTVIATTTTSLATSSLIATSTVVMGTSTTASTIATTTPVNDFVSPYTTIRGQFVDKYIKTKDIREFRSSDGTVLFYYTFIDNNRLLFAADEGLVSEIMARLEKQAFVR